MKYTKIVCTIGPASSSVEVLTKMALNGMNICRLNFSHGTYDSHASLIANIKSVREALNIPLPILQDLQGPKIRVKSVKEGFEVKTGEEVVIGKDFTIDHPLHSEVKVGHRILIQDGLIELKVKKVSGKRVTCDVLNGGKILLHKGVNLPDTKLKLSSLTPKDIKDLRWGLKQGVDFVALSFVRTAADLNAARQMIVKYLPKGAAAPKLVCKVEKPEAVKHINQIVNACDVVMVARGDLGVEMPDFEVPVLQRQIVEAALNKAKPVIVATQMLESMVTNPRPTRAEVNDVATAVLEHADGTMLSEESAFGKYPAEAVKEMAKVIEYTEKSKYELPQCPLMPARVEVKIAKLAQKACEAAVKDKKKAIVLFSNTGIEAKYFGRMRPGVPCFIFTSLEEVYRQVEVSHGVFPMLIREQFKDASNFGAYAISELLKKKYLKKGDEVLVII